MSFHSQNLVFNFYNNLLIIQYSADNILSTLKHVTSNKSNLYERYQIVLFSFRAFFLYLIGNKKLSLLLNIKQFFYCLTDRVFMFCLAFITFNDIINQKQTKRKLFILIIKFNKKKEFKLHEPLYN